MTFKNLADVYGQNNPVISKYRMYNMEISDGTPQSLLLDGGTGKVYDDDALVKICKNLKKGDVISLLNTSIDKTARDTGFSYTIIGTGNPSIEHIGGYCYAVCHQSNEYVASVKVDKLGYLDLTGNNIINFGQLVHIKRIGIVTTSSLGAAGGETIDIKDGSGTTALGTLTFANNDVAGTFYEVNVDYIGNKLWMKWNAIVNVNTGKALVYVVYDNDLEVKVIIPQHYVSATAKSFTCIKKVYGKLVSVSNLVTKDDGVTGANRFVIKNGANAATEPASLDSPWVPKTDGNEIFKGGDISSAQTVHEVENHKNVYVESTLHFEAIP